MTKSRSLPLILSALVLCAAAAAVFMSVASQSDSHAHTPFSKVINPDIPDRFTICGQEIDLTRTDMWERFDRELTSMAYAHGSTQLILKRANKVFPRLAPILEKNGIPLDVLYLAVTESSLDQRAYSAAKAAGIWQFIPSTAKDFGLEVSDEVDERYNMEKATEAACRYLRAAYRKYNDWPTVFASYNAGQGRISNELSAQDVGTSMDLYLVSETSRYVFRIMAAKAIMEQPRTFGFHLKAHQFYQPIDYQEVEVADSVPSWPQWAKERGITYAQLVEANPWIRAKKLTNPKGKKYTVLVPDTRSLTRDRHHPRIYNKSWTD